VFASQAFFESRTLAHGGAGIATLTAASPFFLALCSCSHHL
jgi:hypothetical protein